MFRWEEPIWLNGLWVMIPVVILGIAGLYLNRRKRKLHLSEAGEERLFPGRIRWMPGMQLALVTISLGLLFIALANPQWGIRKSPAKVKSTDAYILLDISQSMLAEDIAPNRLERAKRATIDLIDRLKGDRIALVLFSGSAWLQMPLTTDYAAAELFVQAAHPGLAPVQGTSVGDALRITRESFTEDSKQFKTVFIVSDGEDHEEEAEAEIEFYKQAGIPVYTLGVGTSQGGFIPVHIQGRADYKRDESGNFIKSTFDSGFLTHIANSTNGKFYKPGEQANWLENIEKAIAEMQRREVEQRSFTEFESYFSWFAGAAMLLILLRLLLPSARKNAWV